ncbi:MAG: DUF484 family protein [Pseudomonadota bacterium]
MVASPSSPTEEQVKDYLLNHPDFLIKHGEIIEYLDIPARQLGDKVADLQKHRIEKNEQNLQAYRDFTRELTHISIDNEENLRQIHFCIKTMAAAPNPGGLLHYFERAARELFGLEAIVLLHEATQEPNPAWVEELPHLHICAPGTVNKMLDYAMLLARAGILADGHYSFAKAQESVQSDVLVRLSDSPFPGPCMLWMGSKHAGHFDPAQGFNFLEHLVDMLGLLLAIMKPQDYG